MALLLLVFFSVPLFFLTRWLLPTEANTDFWVLISLAVSVFAKPVNDALNAFGARVTSKWRLHGTRPFAEVFRYDYADLVAILFATVELDQLFLASFQNAVSQLAAANFIAFPRGDDGFIHLQLYVGGFIALPSFAVALGLYGLSRGLQLKPTRFWQLSIAFLVAYACIAGFVYATQGAATLRENYALVQHANPGALPASKALVVVTRAAFALLLVAAGTGYTWLFVNLGSVLLKASTNPNSHITLQSVLIGLLLIVLLGAVGWRVLRRSNHSGTQGSGLVHPSTERAQIGITDTPKLVIKVGQPVLALVPVVNTGSRPAVGIKTQVAILNFPKTLDEQQRYDAMENAREKLPFQEDGTIPAGGHRTTEVHTIDRLTQEQRMAIHNGEQLLYLTEVLEYTDGSGTPHRTEACFHIIAEPNDTRALRGLFAYCSKGNAAD